MTAIKDPKKELENLSKSKNLEIDSYDFAEFLDSADEVAHLREQFFYPKMKELPHVDLKLVNPEDECIYMIGNSLGLQPKRVKHFIDQELETWAKTGVYGHREGHCPWALCDEYVTEGNAKLVGAKQEEIAVMNGLSVNIHLLMIPFYLPTKERYKVLLEAKAFPSDHYIIESQIKLRGYDPKQAMICMEPREGETCLRTGDIISLLENEGPEIALVFFSGVQYYTGQLFDIETITKAAQKKGCTVGWDLAHATGNVPLKLHEWGVDFATWCSYKYMNCGAGGLSGIFVHEKHNHNDYPKLLGWWGQKDETRFVMDNVMDLSIGAAGYRISNPPILLVCPMLASLEIFSKTTMEELRNKSLLLTTYLEFLINHFFGKDSSHRKTELYCEILTPNNPAERGCQLSIKFSHGLRTVFEELQKRGVACDERLPYVLRISPVHLYTKFTDVRRFIDALKQSLDAAQK